MAGDRTGSDRGREAQCGLTVRHPPVTGAGGGPGRVGWFVINLDRSSDRLAATTRSLAALGIVSARIRAVDGQSLSWPIDGIDPALWRRMHGRAPVMGEIGCYISHLRALREFVASRFPYAMILEDDAAVTRDALDHVERLTAPTAPDDWDLVKFETHHGRIGLPIRRLTGRSRLCALPFRSAGSAAYLVNRAAAASLLDRLLPMRLPYDLAFDRCWELRIRVRAILPSPITTPRCESTIRPAVGTAPRRAPRAFRAYTKAMRVIAAFHAFVRPDRPFPWPTPVRDRAVTGLASIERHVAAQDGLRQPQTHAPSSSADPGA